MSEPMLETMNPYVTAGTKIRFSFKHNGNQYDQLVAGEHLRIGAEYTVKHIRVGEWKTDVYLEEVQGVPFNSKMFNEVEKEARYKVLKQAAELAKYKG